MGFDLFDWLVILLIVLIIFGAGKLPQAGDALGRAVKNFRKATKGDEPLDVTPQPQITAGEPAPARPRLEAPTARAAEEADLAMPELGARRKGGDGQPPDLAPRKSNG